MIDGKKEPQIEGLTGKGMFVCQFFLRPQIFMGSQSWTFLDGPGPYER